MLPLSWLIAVHLADFGNGKLGTVELADKCSLGTVELADLCKGRLGTVELADFAKDRLCTVERVWCHCAG